MDGADERAGDGPGARSPTGPDRVWRVRTRAEFARVRRHGRTVRQGPVAVRFCPAPNDAPPSPPCVAYAIGRRVGPAVVRNTIRRRMRHIVADLARTHDIPQGISLIMAQPEVRELPSHDLRTLLEAAFAAHRASVARSVASAPPGAASG